MPLYKNKIDSCQCNCRRHLNSESCGEPLKARISTLGNLHRPSSHPRSINAAAIRATSAKTATREFNPPLVGHQEDAAGEIRVYLAAGSHSIVRSLPARQQFSRDARTRLQSREKIGGRRRRRRSPERKLCCRARRARSPLVAVSPVSPQGRGCWRDLASNFASALARYVLMYACRWTGYSLRPLQRAFAMNNSFVLEPSNENSDGTSFSWSGPPNYLP